MRFQNIRNKNMTFIFSIITPINLCVYLIAANYIKSG